MLWQKHCPTVLRVPDMKKVIAHNARMSRRRRCINAALFAAAVTVALCPFLLKTETGNLSVYKMDDQRYEQTLGADKVEDIKRKTLMPLVAGYIGKTNSVISRAFTEADFTYTGSRVWIDEGNGNFRLKFLTSGTFTPKKAVIIDIFLVGGGGGGGSYANNSRLGGGGAGGYAGTYASITLVANQAYTIVIGAGGAAGASGGSTTGFGNVKGGGGPGDITPSYYSGGSGGSGGGQGTAGGGQAGGSNGSNGGGSWAGLGQGTTTREFGEAGGALYSGAGGGGTWDTGVGGAGGAGGGGRGSNGQYVGGGAVAGTVNTGGGGGGRGDYVAEAGGSGVLIVRNKR